MTSENSTPPSGGKSPGNLDQPAPKDPLALPPLGKKLQRFSMVIFLLIGAGIAAFVLMNPFAIPFLPRPGGSVVTREGSTTPTPERNPVLYQCPMHPEVIEEQPGNCPICQMKLVPLEFEGSGSDAPAKTPVSEKDTQRNREILYYYAPMDPTYISDSPGVSPMGMKLVPKYKGEAGGEEGLIQVDPIQVQNMGVLSVDVRRSNLNRIIRTVGILDFDADNVYWINTKYSGWIEKVHVNYAGQETRKGQPLFEIYSPELVTTQEEYLRALEYRDSLAGSTRPEVLRQAEDLLSSTRNRLDYWDISSSQISELEQRKQVQRTLSVTSPVDGLVIEVMDEALEGMFVKPGMNLYKLADLSSIWVHVDVFESDLSWISQGQPAEVQLSYYPGETFRGQVLFLQPELNQMTRTVKVCVELPNPRLRLKPGMYANVRIKGRGLKDVLAVPDSAILRSGERDVVFLDLGQGRYLAREVELGLRGEDNLVEIRKGLSDGQKVVVQAQFMLDSESRVQEAIRHFKERKGKSEAPSQKISPDEPDSHPATKGGEQ